MFIGCLSLAFVYTHFKISAFQNRKIWAHILVLLGCLTIAYSLGGLSSFSNVFETKCINQYKLKYELQYYIVLLWFK